MSKNIFLFLENQPFKTLVKAAPYKAMTSKTSYLYLHYYATSD